MRIALTAGKYLACACLVVSAALFASAVYIDNFGFANELDEATRNELAAEESLNFFALAIACLLTAAVFALATFALDRKT